MFKINHFFTYHSTPKPNRLTVVSFAMEGQALAWFQWMTRCGQITSWLGFLQALEGPFALSQYEDPTGILSKLTQTSSVAKYLSQFETLANRTIRLPTPFLLSFFISSLVPEIRHEVQVLQPLTLTNVTALTRLHDEKLVDHRRPFRGRFTAPSPPLLSKNLPPPLLSPPAKPHPLPLKRLSPEEMAIRQEKGLCFNCNEKFSRGHRCSSKFFILIVEAENAAANSNPIENELPSTNTSSNLAPAQISFYALSGHLAPETL